MRCSGPAISLKTWSFELIMVSWTTDICTVRGLSIEESKISTECTDHVFCLASSQGGELAPYMLMAHFGSGLKQGHHFSSMFLFKASCFDTLLQTIQFFPTHCFLLLCFVLLWSHPFFFAQAFPINLNWKPLPDNTLHLNPPIQVENSY